MAEHAKPTTEDARERFESIVREMGTPRRKPVKRDEYTPERMFVGETGNGHPTYALAHHFRSNDDYEKGYTENPYRGDHMSIPITVESPSGPWNEVIVLDVSFHKGDIFIEEVSFPNATPEQIAAARTILGLWYTR